MKYLTAGQEAWVESHAGETLELMRTLGKIPAPSHMEDKRCAFVKKWLDDLGYENVHIDEAKNVVCPINVKPGEPVNVVMAHTDIVFPDMEELEMREEGGRLYAPGIGDDTANLVNLLMSAKYIKEQGIMPKHGLLLVANSCEEGLGNLKGSWQLVNTYGDRIDEYISFDGSMDAITDNAVGSTRMCITVTAQGGHSYAAFGNTNAIVQMSELITELYKKKVPSHARTTYNAGVIEGGTTVNSICARCSLLYEYRSEDRGCLEEMKEYTDSVIESFRAKGYNIDVEILGIRPCAGDVDTVKESALLDAVSDIIKDVTGKVPARVAMSTDANASLSRGIPSTVIGTADGHGAHTRGEWVTVSSMVPGQKIGLATVLRAAGR